MDKSEKTEFENFIASAPLEELERGYTGLAAKCSNFDQETINQRRKLKDALQKWELNRKNERQSLLEMKLIVTRRLVPLRAEHAKKTEAQREQEFAEYKAAEKQRKDSARQAEIDAANERLNAIRENKKAETAAAAAEVESLLLGNQTDDATAPSTDPNTETVKLPAITDDAAAIAEADRIAAEQKAESDRIAAEQAEADRLAAEQAAAAKRKEEEEKAAAEKAEAERIAAAKAEQRAAEEKAAAEKAEADRIAAEQAAQQQQQQQRQGGGNRGNRGNR